MRRPHDQLLSRINIVLCDQIEINVGADTPMTKLEISEVLDRAKEIMLRNFDEYHADLVEEYQSWTDDQGGSLKASY